MKKYINLFLICLMVAGPAMASDINPMFGPGNKNGIAIYAAQGTGPGTLFKMVDPFLWEFEPMTFAMLQYSQPIDIFRLPSRMNFNVMQNFRYGHDRGLSFFAVGVSWDVALVNWRGFYIGLGLGPYMRDSRDRYVASRLVFGERVFIGKNLGNDWHLEIFTQHFSNGDFTDINRGFNFTGLAISYNF